jgi:hypothetical protein
MFDQASLPLDQLPATLRWILQQAEANYRLAGRLQPSLYATTPSGEIKEVSGNFLMAHKEQTAGVMEIIAALDFTSVTLVTEAWILITEQGKEESALEVARRGEIHLHPNRKEVLQSIYGTPTEEYIAYLSINEGKVIGEWKVYKNEIPEDDPVKTKYNNIYARGAAIRQRPGFHEFKDQISQFLFP